MKTKSTFEKKTVNQTINRITVEICSYHLETVTLLYSTNKVNSL